MPVRGIRTPVAFLLRRGTSRYHPFMFSEDLHCVASCGTVQQPLAWSNYIGPHNDNNTFTTFPWPEERTDSAIYVSCTYGTIRCNRPCLTRYMGKRSVSTVVIAYSGIV
jgi:hypothetical protein